MKSWRCSRCGQRLVDDRQGMCCGRKMAEASALPSQQRRHRADHTRRRLDCRHRGEELRQQACATCGGNVRIKVFACGLHGECTTHKRLGRIDCCATCNDYAPALRWFTHQQLALDALSLAPKLPADLSGIVGVPRSGMLPAAVLATHLHLPLFSLFDHTKKPQLIPVGNGWRLASEGFTTTPVFRGDGPLLVIDDSSFGGHTSARVRRAWPAINKELGGAQRGLIFAAVYSTGRRMHRAGPMPDLTAELLEPPHFFEWHFFNSSYVFSTGFDFDGILTIDGTLAPLYLPRKNQIPLIVTGRLERHRAGSQAWLDKHGVRVGKMIMYPGTEQERDRPGELARYKAAHLKESGLKWFIESDPEQAAGIAKISGKPVICPGIAKVFS